jgi:hypothetical protein
MRGACIHSLESRRATGIKKGHATRLIAHNTQNRCALNPSNRAQRQANGCALNPSNRAQRQANGCALNPSNRATTPATTGRAPSSFNRAQPLDQTRTTKLCAFFL